MVLGLVLALVSCILYGIATLVQAAGSKKAEGLQTFVQPLVIIGLVIDGGAFLVSLVAYQYAPLFLVQTIIGAAVVISVLGAPRFLPGVSLRTIDLVGAAIVLVGLVVIAGAAGPEDPRKPGSSFVTALIIIAVVVAALTAIAYTWAPAWVMAVLAWPRLLAGGRWHAGRRDRWQHLGRDPAPRRHHCVARWSRGRGRQHSGAGARQRSHCGLDRDPG